MKKIAIITGAGTGIGQGAALAMLKEGWNIFLVGRREKKLHETKNIALSKGYKGLATIYSADISNERSVKELYNLVNTKYKRLDILFNNAGISLKINTIDKISYNDWKKLINVNINGMFLMAKYAFKLMKKQKPKGGRIINNGSISSYVPRPGSVAYTTSKHAITGLTKTLSLDGRIYSINCSQIDIGNAATDMKKEIERLKKQGMDGLVIDLRNNGGGSLKTVVDIGGLFINKGPIVQVRSTGYGSEVLRDRDPEISWDGALVVLVNEFSASASEILAVESTNTGTLPGPTPIAGLDDE